MANLFDKAEKRSLPKKPKKEKKQVTIVEKDFFDSVATLANLKTEIATLTAQMNMIDNDVRSRAFGEFLKMYKQESTFTESFLIKAYHPEMIGSASFLFIPTDRYLQITPEQAVFLEEKYAHAKEKPNDLVITQVEKVYTFNKDLVQKYGEVISELIENCEDIDEDDKEKLIEATVTHSIKKGTIKNIMPLTRKKDIKKKIECITVENVIEDILPVFQLKDVKID